ncbi:MAG TPA: hypothetical protein DEP24_00905 [Mycobacterium sp.]|nr:hypothetical protein [Mycobacterium sp.]
MSDIKASNPKDAIGSRKVGLSRVSLPVVMEMDVAMFEGSLKYGRHNYRAIGVRTSVYFDAALRHLFAFWEGQDIDPDSGLSHITKALASLAVLRDAQLQDKVDDDRPPVSVDFIAGLNAKVAALIEKYPNPVEPWTQGRVTPAGTFTDQEWADAHVANGVFDTTAVYESGGSLSHLEGAVVALGHSVKTQLGCCTAMVGPGRGEILSPDYSGPDRRDELRGDRRVNKKFSSSMPNLRKKQLHSGSSGFYWGRRITDPVAY